MTVELDANHAAFEQRWKAQRTQTEDGLEGHDIFGRAFRRLVAMQAWRSELLDTKTSTAALQFAIEGQNDLLAAYLLARGGQWRSALQAQRAALENYLNFLFFKDHPVELELWADGRYQTQFSELLSYFLKHPLNSGREPKRCGLDTIKSEYAVLSKAVHGSAAAFRMSSDDGPKFFVQDQALLGKWDHRNRLVVRGLCLLMLSLFRDDLVATRKRNLRKSLALALRPGDKGWIKNEYQVTIPF